MAGWKSFLKAAEEVLGTGAAREEVEALSKKLARQAVKPAGKTAAKAVEVPSELSVANLNAPAIVKNVTGSAKRKAEKSGLDLSVFKERYPETAPPVRKFDKKKNDYYWAKAETPEAKALTKVRKGIVDEMKSEGYTPFFNPDERFYVDPSQYDLPVNTLDIMPAREDTIASYTAKAYDPAALDRLRAAYELGAQYPGSKQWYATGQLEDAFKQILGAEAGREAYKRNFADAMAATTGGMDPEANLRLAHYMNVLRESGSATPLASHELPYPIGGGKYGIMPNVAQYEAIINRGGGLGLQNPKRYNFSGNFLGDVNKATIDEQMFGAWDPTKGSPPSNSYGVYERALHDLARELGVPPAEAQDVMWAGIKVPKDKTYTPRPMIDTINDAIERTSRLTGMEPEQVVEESLVKAKRPLFAEGGSVDREALFNKYNTEVPAPVVTFGG